MTPQRRPLPMTTAPFPKGALPWDQLRSRLDESQPFNLMRNTPYYRDAVYEQFSKEEYARRYAALRAKMREEKIDAVIVPGGPSHWSFGGGMLWLTGHWEWHALCCYVVVPLNGDPTLVYSMGGTHAEAVRRLTSAALSDVRGSRGGQYAAVIADRLVRLRLERGRIGLLEIDPRHKDYLPVKHDNVLLQKLPDAAFVFPRGWKHAPRSADRHGEAVLGGHHAAVVRNDGGRDQAGQSGVKDS